MNRLFLLLLLPLFSQAQPVKTGKVAPYMGRPTIFVNDQPQSPQLYALTHVYGGRWSWEERPARNLHNFCEAGIRLYQVDLYFEDIWQKDRPELDIAKAQRQVRGVLDACPDAAVFLRIHVNAPFWWNEQHREECTEYADGPVDKRRYGPPFNMEDGDIDRPLRASLASMRWRQEAGAKLKTFCEQFSRTREGAAVVGLHLSGGIYGEWHYWGFIEHEPDTGPAMTRYFRQWLTKKYGTSTALQQAWKSSRFTLQNATVPDTTERNFTADGIFRNPETEQRTIDYFMAQQEVVVEDIEHFCHIAKANWGRPVITGVFYGYFHMTFNRQAVGGHILVERILNCPDLDYLAAPQTYWECTRRLGGSGIARGIVESTLLHGKLWLDEMDNGYLQSDLVIDPVRSRDEADTAYLAVFKRSVELPMLRGSGLWYYDFGPQRSAGWWDHPVYMETVKQQKAFFDRQLHWPHQSVADVLYVYDQDNFHYIKNRWTPVSEFVLDQGVEDAMRAGVAADHIYLFDLERVNLDQYKAVVFVNCFHMTAAQRQLIREKVAQRQRTLVFNYLSGYTDGRRNSLDHLRELTGITFEKGNSPDKPVVQFGDSTYTVPGKLNPAISIKDASAQVLARVQNNEPAMVSKQFDQYRIILAAYPLQRPHVFRSILKSAGCHVYNNEDDFTYAHGNLVLLHSALGGPRVIRLRNGKSVSLQVPAASTWLIDAETGAMIQR